MKQLKWRKIIPGCLLIVIFSCGSLGGDTLVLLTPSSDPTSTEIGNALNTDHIQFILAKVVLNHLIFEKSDVCNPDEPTSESTVEEVKYEEGPYVIDLLHQKSSPNISQLRLSKGTYCRFTFALDQLGSNELPSDVASSDEIVDLSVLIKGSFNSATDFMIRVADDQDYVLNSSSSKGFDFTPDQLDEIFLIFDLNKIFENVDLNTLSQTDGLIKIDSTHNTTAFAIVKNNLRAFSKLIKDTDRDGLLEEDDEVFGSAE